MITIISGTNRPGSNSRKVAAIIESNLRSQGEETQLVDLQELPRDIFVPENYGKPPATFAPFQEKMSATDGIITVVPEYNGSYPGALKYFIDLLKFPETLNGMPSAFVGVSAGVFGSLRSIEQLQMVFQYRSARLFNKYVLLPKVHEKLDSSGSKIIDDFTRGLFEQFLKDFPVYAKKNTPRSR